MTGIAKSVGRKVKRLGRSLKKTWKRVYKSPFFKAALIVGAIWLGGVALSAWGGGAGAGAATGATVNTGLASTVAGSGGAAASGAAGAATTAATTAAGTVATAAPTAAAIASGATTVGNAAALTTGAAGKAASGGLIKSIMAGAGKIASSPIGQGIGKFASSSLGQAAIAGGVQAALTPSEQEMIDKENARRAANYDVSGINFNFNRTAAPQSFQPTQVSAVRRPGVLRPRI